MHCQKYRGERLKFAQKVGKAGREWSMDAILRTVGEGVKDTQKAVV